MMRKNSKFYLGILLVSGMLGLSSPARSQLVGGVSFDFGGDAAAAITPVFEQIQTAADEAVKYAKEKVTKLKASIGSYFTKRKNAAEKVPGTKQFAEETSVDIYDPAAVQTAINELFLQYPSSDQRVNRFYEKEAAEFYYDTMIEIQTASKKLEAQLNSLRTEIDNFSKDAIAPSGGNAGSMSSSDENGNYYNLYLAHKKFNDVLKVTEEVMALYSQYYVARAIYRKTILPAPYQEESAEGEGKKSAASRYFSSKMAFAQFVSGSTASAAAEEEEAEDMETKRSSYTEVNFAVPEAPEAKSLMAGSEKELADLGVISDAQKSLNEALKAHNTIRLLPTYRNIFRQYELFKQMHEKAAQAVGVIKAVRQGFHADILPIYLQNTLVQQCSNFRQVLPDRHRAGIIRRDLRNAGILGMQGGIQRNFKVAVAAFHAVGLAGAADEHNVRVHNGIRRIVAQKAQRILDLRLGVGVVQQGQQKGAGLILVHTVAKQRQVIGAVLALFPHFIAEKAVRPIGTGGKRCGALQFIMDGMRGLLGDAHMGVAFRHRGVTSF